MNRAPHLAGLLCTLAILVVGTPTMHSLSIVYFIVTGTLVPGEDMYITVVTPTISSALMAAAIGAALMAGLAFARHKLLSAARS